MYTKSISKEKCRSKSTKSVKCLNRQCVVSRIPNHLSVHLTICGQSVKCTVWICWKICFIFKKICLFHSQGKNNNFFSFLACYINYIASLGRKYHFVATTTDLSRQITKQKSKRNQQQQRVHSAHAHHTLHVPQWMRRKEIITISFAIEICEKRCPITSTLARRICRLTYYRCVKHSVIYAATEVKMWNFNNRRSKIRKNITLDFAYAGR